MSWCDSKARSTTCAMLTASVTMHSVDQCNSQLALAGMLAGRLATCKCLQGAAVQCNLATCDLMQIIVWLHAMATNTFVHPARQASRLCLFSVALNTIVSADLLQQPNAALTVSTWCAMFQTELQPDTTCKVPLSRSRPHVKRLTDACAIGGCSLLNM